MGHTVVAVTHRPALVGLADQLLVLQAGRMVAMGPPQEVVNKFQQQNAQTHTAVAQSANAPQETRAPSGFLPQGGAS
jgi:ABC-type protease/lipase transport system fused ATPase/permease subunit